MPLSEYGAAVPPPGCPARPGKAVRGPVTSALAASGRSLYTPLYTPEFTADPRAAYQRLREYGPAAPVELAPGVPAWLVVGYTAALEVLRTPETFSNDSRRWRALNAGEVPADSPVLPMMGWQPYAMFADGEEHHRLRRPITDSLARVDRLTLHDHVERHADRLVDRFAAAGEADLVGQYALALPVLVLGELCGAPTALGERFLDAASKVASGADAQAAFAEMTGLVTELVALKRERPGVDVTSWMLAHPAGLTHDELIATLLLFMAGGSLLQSLMASGLRLLLSDDRFAGDLAGGSLPVDGAIDEVLWNGSPVANHGARYPVRDVDLEGVQLHEGDLVLISFAAANIDPSAAVSSRAGNRGHLAWGAGPHTCPAQNHARLMATVAMEKLLDRLPDVELAVPVDELEWMPGPFFRAPAALPVRFPPAPLSEPASPAGPAAASAVAGAEDRPGSPVPEAAEASTDAAAGETPAPVNGALGRAGRLFTTWRRHRGR